MVFTKNNPPVCAFNKVIESTIVIHPCAELTRKTIASLCWIWHVNKANEFLNVIATNQASVLQRIGNLSINLKVKFYSRIVCIWVMNLLYVFSKRCKSFIRWVRLTYYWSHMYSFILSSNTHSELLSTQNIQYFINKTPYARKTNKSLLKGLHQIAYIVFAFCALFTSSSSADNFQLWECVARRKSCKPPRCHKWVSEMKLTGYTGGLPHTHA